MADQGPASSDLKQWLDSQSESLRAPETALSPYHDTEDDFMPKTPSAASQRPAVLSPNYKEDRYLWHEDGKDDYPQMDLAKQAYRGGPAEPTRYDRVIQSLEQEGPATREELAARLGIEDPSWDMLSYSIGGAKAQGYVYEKDGVLYHHKYSADPQMPKVTKEFARDLSLKLLAVAMEEEAKEEQQKESMAASPEAWEDASRTRSWYHGTPTNRVDRVLAEGLLPGQGGDWDGSYMAPRPGHVYLTSDPTEAKMRGSGKTEDMPYTTVLQIDPSYLDPANISPDEDLMSDQIKRDHGIGYMRDDAQYKSVGDLAEGLGWGDETSVTDPYARRGSPLAYRGAIPPEALSVYTDPEGDYSDCMYCGEYTPDDDGAYCGECGMNKYAKTSAEGLPEVVYIDTPAQYKSWLAAEAPWIYDQENDIVYTGKAYQRHADIAEDIPGIDIGKMWSGGVHGVIKLHVPDKPLFVINDAIDVPDTVRQALANWSGKDIRSEWPGYQEEFNALYDEAFGKPHHLTSVLEQTDVQEQAEDTKDEESDYAKAKRMWYDGVWREVTPASSEGLEHEE